ncbi:MAG: hypothetical protein GQ581_09070 [Methyloprofundus sp.]|nr:hypothetical protein [Methyloprofundus sp.]
MDTSLLIEINQLSLLCECIDKVILVGKNLPDEQQVQFIQQGALGYSEIAIDQFLIKRTIQRILNNEISISVVITPMLQHGNY